MSSYIENLIHSSKTSKIRVLFVAVGYGPPPVPSDMQFLNDLISVLPKNIEVVVWTVSEIPPTNENVFVGNRKIPLISVNRLAHKPLSNNINSLLPHPRHSAIRNMLEVSISVLWELFSSLKDVVVTHNIDIIHFVDNVGPILPIIRRILPSVHIYYNKPSSRITNSKGWLWYKKLIEVSYKQSDIIIAYSETCKKNLISAGLNDNQIKVIPWGVKSPQSLSSERIKAIRLKYGCTDENTLLIVGIPRCTDNELLEIVKFAKEVSTYQPTRFVFAIRPTLYKDSYQNLASEQVKVLSGPDNFYELLAAADLAFAHQSSNIVSTTLPPLAWVEAMIRGTPIIAKRTVGAEETVIKDLTGLLYDELYEIDDWLYEILSNRQKLIKMKHETFLFVNKKYNIINIAKQYLDIWSNTTNCNNVSSI